MPTHRSLISLLIALLALTGTTGQSARAQATCNPALPSSCGQVRALAGGTLADDGGRWPMRGVQFFLPQYGINGKTLRDDNYAAARADGSLNFWLERAQGYLHANMLRVFVDLPDTVGGSTTVITPTSYSTLHDFATAADAHGMRLGLVLHNSADWSMTEPRASWIAGLLDYFAQRGSLPMLAYLSADNEINNHCANIGMDCFDSGPGFDAQAYIDGAVGWVAQFRSVVKNHACGRPTLSPSSPRSNAQGPCPPWSDQTPRGSPSPPWRR